MNQPSKNLNYRLLSSQSTNETSWSQDDLKNKESDTSISSNDDKPKYPSRFGDVMSSETKIRQEEESYSSQLLKFFSDDSSAIPYFIYNPPFDFNINEPIDDEGHTPLHWAASIGNYPMIHLLLSKGASPLDVNNFGLNPLSKLISFNNCYELKNFPKVLDDLELCLINTDINGRTPLHYLCQFSKVRSKHESLHYYLNIIINKLTTMANQYPSNKIDLLKNVLDHQDVNGDTCLLLAAKSGSAKIVRVLLEYGARDDLENINKETARMIIMATNLLPEYAQQQERMWQQQYQQSNTNQFGQELRPQYVQPIMENSNVPTQQSFPPTLETPVQPPRNGSAVETPDTQRTAIQEDDMDEDNLHTARVDKTQLDTLSDNKENIFMNGKGFELSTPLSKAPNQVQPLTSISEKSSDGTPVKATNYLSIQQSHKPCPPDLDNDGNIVSNETRAKLRMEDLLLMIQSMISSLANSHNQELIQMEKNSESLKSDIEKKHNINAETLSKFKQVLKNTGITDFNTVEEGKEVLNKEIQQFKEKVSQGELALLSVLKRNYGYRLNKEIQEFELKILNDQDDLMTSSDTIWNYAVDLTKLQVERSKLLVKLSESMKNFGIDSKMYKYRKLISSSCGLKVEDIDGLIDGIEESLVESMT